MEYTAEAVKRKLDQTFQAEDRAAAEAILNEVNDDFGQNRERIQLALLKLSGGKIEDLRCDLKLARLDFRDVLAAAEYPAQLKSDSWKLSPEENKKLIEKDLEQYLQWLNADSFSLKHRTQ